MNNWINEHFNTIAIIVVSIFLIGMIYGIVYPSTQPLKFEITLEYKSK